MADLLGYLRLRLWVRILNSGSAFTAMTIQTPILEILQFCRYCRFVISDTLGMDWTF